MEGERMAKCGGGGRPWARAVAPVAEWVARRLWTRKNTPARQTEPPTRLTQARRRKAQGGTSVPPDLSAPRFQRLCRGCGKPITRGQNHCADCAVSLASERFVDAARLGRAKAHTPEARAKEGQKQRQHAEARNSWTPSSKPEWLTAKCFDDQIQPRLARLSNSSIASRIGVSRWYAGRIRQGHRPHLRHWQVLAELVGLFGACEKATDS